MSKKSTLKKALVAAAVAAALGTAGAASAATVKMDWTGLFTMVNATGTGLQNGDAGTAGWYGWRTPVSGTMTLNTTTGAGTGTVQAFSFYGSGLASATTITMQAIGDGSGGAGSLVLGNMGFNWNGNNGIPVSIVMDAQGLFNAISGGATVGQVITGVGATPATSDTVFGVAGTKAGTYTLPIGPAPVATTIWNTTDIGTVVLGTNPSGTLPLITDTTGDVTNGDVGIGGSPMEAGPFAGYNANFDMTSLTVTSVVAPVPIPAAAWLFGSGLLGLVGVARRRRDKS